MLWLLVVLLTLRLGDAYMSDSSKRAFAAAAAALPFRKDASGRSVSAVFVMTEGKYNRSTDCDVPFFGGGDDDDFLLLKN